MLSPARKKCRQSRGAFLQSVLLIVLLFIRPAFPANNSKNSTRTPTSRAPAVSSHPRSAEGAKTPAIDSIPSPEPVSAGPGVLTESETKNNSTISPTPLVVPILTLAPSAAPSLKHLVINDLTFYILNIDRIMEENEKEVFATFLLRHLTSMTFVKIESINITSNRVLKNKVLEIKIEMKAYPTIFPITPTKEKLEKILFTQLTHHDFLHTLQNKIGYFELACKVLENRPKKVDVCGVSRSESLTNAPTTVPPTTSSKINTDPKFRTNEGKKIWSVVGVVILFSAVAFVVTGVWSYKKYRPWSCGARSHRNHQRGAFTFKKPFKKSTSKKEGFFYSEVAENLSFPRDPFEKRTVDEVFKPLTSKKSRSRSLLVSGSGLPSSLQVSTDSSSGTRETPQQWIPFPPVKETVVRNVIPPMIVVQNIDGNDSVMSDVSRTISPTMSELTADLRSGGSRGGRINRERTGRGGSLSSMSIFQNEVLGLGISTSPGADGRDMMTGRPNYLINPPKSRSLEFNHPKRQIPAVSNMKSRSYENSQRGVSLEKNLRKEVPPPIYTYRDDLHKSNREVAHHKRLPPVPKPPRIVAMPSVPDSVLQPYKPSVPSASISVASVGSGATDQSSGRVRLDLDDSTMNDGTASIGSTSSRISQTSRSITSRASVGSRNLVTRSRASRAGRASLAIPADLSGQRPPTSKNHRRTVSDDSTVCGYRYTFHVPSSGTLGIIIEASRTNQPTIYQVKDHSPLTGKVEKGDRIVMVGNVSTFGMRTADVTARLKKERRRAAEKDMNIRITVECEKEKKGHRDENFKRKRRRAASPLASEISDDISRSIKEEKGEKMRLPSSRTASPMLSEGRIRNERLISSQ